MSILSTLLSGIGLLVYLVIPTGLLCIAQYFLCRIESPWPGRILPILSAVSSVCVTLLVLFNILSGNPLILLLPLGILLVMNIPTAVYLIIYKRTRKNHVEKKNMKKMNIQDLE